MLLRFLPVEWPRCVFALCVVSCGGRVAVDDEAQLSGATAGSGASSSSSSSASSGVGGGAPEYPCSAPEGPGLTHGELCLVDVPVGGCPASDDPALQAALFAQVLAECEASFASCCPVSLSVRCGPNPAPAAPGACCYVVLTAVPPDGTCL